MLLMPIRRLQSRWLPFKLSSCHVVSVSLFSLSSVCSAHTGTNILQMAKEVDRTKLNSHHAMESLSTALLNVQKVAIISNQVCPAMAALTA